MPNNKFVVIQNRPLNSSVPFILHGLFDSFDDATTSITNFMTTKEKQNAVIISMPNNEWMTDKQFQYTLRDNTRCIDAKLLESTNATQTQTVYDSKRVRRRNANNNTRKTVEFDDLYAYLQPHDNRDDFAQQHTTSPVHVITRHNNNVSELSNDLRNQYEYQMRSTTSSSSAISTQRRGRNTDRSSMSETKQNNDDFRPIMDPNNDDMMLE